MMNIVAMIFVTWVLTGCKDIPYKELESTLNLDEATAKNAVPVGNDEKESAKKDHVSSSTDPPNRNVDNPIARPVVVEIEDADSNDRSRSNGRSNTNTVAPPSLVAVIEEDEEVENLNVPNIEITSPPNNSLIAAKQFEIKGTIEYPELIRNIMVRYQGLSEANILVTGEKTVTKAEKNFGVMIEDLPDGDYRLSVIFVDINGIEYLLPALKISIDCTPPEIFGALDGIEQPAYLQEGLQHVQKFINDANNPRYEIEPAGEAAPLTFQTIPTISRWHTRILDEKTAPTYVFKISEINIAAVNYAIDYECASFEKASHEAVKKEDGDYEIKIVPMPSDSDLDGKKFCLSIWATDLAGNEANHQAEFIWEIVVPPVAVDMNSVRYAASHRRDDVTWADLPVRQLFRDTIPIELKRDLVVAHTIISNPFSSPLAIKLEMKKPLNLKIHPRFYNIPANSVVIKYSAYDLAKNEIGLERTLNDDFVTIDGNETLVAKFILARNFPLTSIRHPAQSFWRSFSLEVGFALASGISERIVDGLSIITCDSVAGSLSNKFVVPWGEEHQIRRRSASSERGRR